eukprot:TRINITY_DN3513_c0_g2_i1.p1 TRINITY_DN3513_c0_g2~~TRINITY_DN3513_c0_g2_i1.p1  ORF type:complete len:284 (-),score=53.78 TRINITY_DN3513_c0_g2_i1:188-1039(-)
MYYRSNIILVVGGGVNPVAPPTKVMIWDDSKSKFISELLFEGDVRSIKVSKEKFAVCLESKVFVYNFTELRLIEKFMTAPNIQGLCAMNTDGADATLAYLEAGKEGSVGVKNYNKNKTISIRAHKSAVRCLELSPSGERLATASEKGTLIRIFNAITGEQLHELRRGTQQLKIFSLSFHPSNDWLACASDSGTLHIFNVSNSGEAVNTRSKLSFMKVVSNYFDSEWSFAQYRIKEKTYESRAIFLNGGNFLSLANKKGKYYMIKFDPLAGGECFTECEQDLFE